MILIGLLWITSWVGNVLSLSEKLPPNLTSKVYLKKVSANSEKLVNQYLKFFVPSQGEVQKKDFCPSVSATVTDKVKFKTTSNLLSQSVIHYRFPHGDYFSYKLLRSLQNFFQLKNTTGQNFSPTPVPVMLVKRKEDNYEVWVNNYIIANLPTEISANLLKQRLTQLLQLPNLDANQLRPGIVDGIPSLMVGNRFLFGIATEISRQINQSAELLAIEWTNNLRVALKAPALTLVQGQMEMYGLKPSKTKLSGLASWYGDYFHGRLTANGETYNQNELTVAHRSLPFNTYLQVTNLQTGKAVIVRVNDRGPYVSPRSLDLSRKAAHCINSETAGVIPYEAVILESHASKMTLKPAKSATGKLPPEQRLATISSF